MIGWLHIQLVIVIFHAGSPISKKLTQKASISTRRFFEKSSSKSTFHHKISPGTGDDVTSIERLVTYCIAVHQMTELT